jgi:hypothetical protein
MVAVLHELIGYLITSDAEAVIQSRSDSFETFFLEIVSRSPEIGSALLISTQTL